MRYLLFQDYADAQAESHAEAIARGCGPVTQYWWALRPTAKGWAVCVPAGDEGSRINLGDLVDAIQVPLAEA
jgi:hypothetical protein